MTTLSAPPAASDPRLQAALRTVTHLTHRVDLMSALGETIWSTHEGTTRWVPQLEAFQFARRSSFQRSMRLIVPVADDALLPADSQHPFAQRSNLVRIWAGIDAGSDGTWWWPKATMTIADGDVDETDGLAVVSLACVSRLAQLDTAFDDTYTIDAGSNFAEAVLELIAPIIPLDTGLLTVTAASTDWVTPRIDVEVGDNRLKLIEDLLDAIGWELVETPVGNIQLGPVGTRDTTGLETVWTYADNGIPAQTVSRSVGARGGVGGIAVHGGNTTVDDEDPILTVWDLDPNSPTYRNPLQSVGAKTIRLESEYIVAGGQALDAGLGMMRRVGGGGALTFTCLPNPAMDAGDVVAFGRVSAGVESQSWMVESVSLPVDASALMTVTIRPSWTPEGDGVIAAPPGPIQTSFADDFNRGDSNLDGDGTDWLEVGWSFNVRNNRAVQLAPKNWVTAWWKDPLVATNHWAQATVAVLANTGDKAGPMIRQDGQGSGFALLADTDDVVSLVRMQARRPVETLASWDAGVSLVGAVLRIEADGPDLAGSVDGTLRVSGSSSGSAAGVRAGLVARSEGSNSPALDLFSAGVL